MKRVVDNQMLGNEQKRKMSKVMIDSNYYQIMASYNQWMNQKLYAICVEIPNAERKKDCGAFFKSIHGTLNHLLYGDRAWMGRFREKSVSVKVIAQELYGDFEQLRQERHITDREIVE